MNPRPAIRTVRKPSATTPVRTPRVAPADAFRLARRLWLQGEGIDIGALAKQLGVGRATVFRWVGSRDQLLGEILWSLCAPTLARALDGAASLHGARRVAAVSEAAIRAMVAFEPLRRFIQLDAEHALRLLTSKAGVVQSRTINAVHQLLQETASNGTWQPPLALETLAYLIVRIGESFIYADTISGQRIDVRDAGLAIELLLSGRLDACPDAPSR